MNEKKTFTIGLFASIAGFALLVLPLFLATPAYAQSPAQDVDNGNCIKCHEDLYFLHDTGNWFCIRESPMPCVACHGGDPTATTQESAHYDRSAHPVVNEDISKCQECHEDEDECCECVSKFDQVAGINQVKLVSPVTDFGASDQIPGLPAIEEQEPVNWLLILEILPLVVIASLALTIYIVHKVRHT
jgi:hypothetical protein